MIGIGRPSSCGGTRGATAGAAAEGVPVGLAREGATDESAGVAPACCNPRTCFTSCEFAVAEGGRSAKIHSVPRRRCERAGFVTTYMRLRSPAPESAEAAGKPSAVPLGSFESADVARESSVRRRRCLAGVGRRLASVGAKLPGLREVGGASLSGGGAASCAELGLSVPAGVCERRF
jgi:hypothetical protein